MWSCPPVVSHRKLSAGLCELVQDFGLVNFVPLAIQVSNSCVLRRTVSPEGIEHAVHPAGVYGCSWPALFLGSIVRLWPLLVRLLE
jgi:hypothetical protein